MTWLPEGPLLWFLNRGTGVALLVLFTLTTVLGVLSAREGRRRLLPAMITQGLHRNLALLSVALLLAHVATAVVDTFVDIRWWQALSPVGATYEPLWLGAGALSLDVIIVVVLTSLLRERIPPRLWRGIHWLSYLAWGLALAHATGIGTDAATPWGRWLGIGCLGAVLLAAAARVGSGARADRDSSRMKVEAR